MISADCFCTVWTQLGHRRPYFRGSGNKECSSISNNACVAQGLPNEGRSPKSGHRMAAEGIPFSWRWHGDMISLNLRVIWEMSVKILNPKLHDDASRDGIQNREQ